MVAEWTPCQAWTDPESFTTCEPGDVRPELLADAIAVATAVLYVKTGRAFPGVCTDTWRPRGSCGCGAWADCRCPSYPFVTLRSLPVTEVTEVTVDGVALPESAWRLGDPDDPHEAGRLYRVDGERWPCCQDIALGVDQAGTWQVVYTWGTPPPAGADLMAERLACEYVKQWTTGKCALTGQFSVITRENLTGTVIPDPGQLIANGQTGLREVDLWVTSINPGGVDRPPKVLTADSLGMGHDPTQHRREMAAVRWPVVTHW